MKLIGGLTLGAKPLFCTTCGHTGKPKEKTRGSFLIELLLWITFIFPGIIYSLWRVSTRIKVCEQCESATLIPPESPMAQSAKRKMQLD